MYLFNTLAQRAQYDLRVMAFGQLQARELAYFQSERSGNVTSLLVEDINVTEKFLRESIKEIVHYATLLTFAAVVFFDLNVVLALITFAAMPFIVVGGLVHHKYITRYYGRVRSANGKLASRVSDAVGGIMTIKTFLQENAEQSLMAEAAGEYKRANYVAVALSSLYHPAIRTCVAISYTIVVWLTSVWAIDGTNGMTLGDIALNHSLIQRILWPLTKFGELADEVSRSSAASQRIFAAIDTPPKLCDPTDPKEPK